MERKSLAQKMQEMKLKQKANEDAEATERQKRKKTKQAKQDIFGNVEAEVQAELAALKMQRDKGREGYNEYIKSHQEELSEPSFGGQPKANPADLWDISDEEDDASPPRAIGGRSSSDEDDMVITSVIASQRLAERASSRTKPPLFFPSLAAVASRKFLLFI